MSLQYRSLFGTSQLDVDEANITNLQCTNANITTLTGGTVRVTSIPANKIVVTDSTQGLTAQGLTNGQVLIGNTSTSSYNANTMSAGASNNLSITNGPGSISIDTVSVPTFSKVQTASTFTVDNSMTTAQIQAVISNTAYNVVEFQTGEYVLSSYLNVNRDRIVLKGNKSYFTLGPATNTPCIFIGDMLTNPPTIRYTDIAIQDFVISGNRVNQTSETCSGKYWIYNNCIGMNYCQDVVVERCRLMGAISGGFTATFNCINVTVNNCSASNNYYDGLTAYGSHNLIFSNNECFGQFNGAGISIDQNCQYVTIVGNNLTNNAHSGIFMRYCHDVTITGNILSGNVYQGVFIAGNYDGTTIGPNTNYVISSNVINNNLQEGMWLQSCQQFTVSNNVICNNSSTGLRTGNDRIVDNKGACAYNNFSGNVICNNLLGFWYDDDNPYAADSRDNYLSLNIIKNNTNGNVSVDATYNVNDDLTLDTKDLRLRYSRDGYYARLSSSSLGSCTLTLPPSNGSANNLLQSDGSGKLSFTGAPSVNSIALKNSGFTTTLTGNPSGTASFQFPSNGGTVGYSLTTDGSGNTSWLGTNSVTSVTNANFTTSSTVFINTGFGVTITPRYSTSRIRVTLSGELGHNGAGFSVFTIMRTVSGVSTDLSGGSGFGTTSTTQNVPWSYNWMDTPATGASITYGVFCYTYDSSAYAHWNGSNITCNIEATEIV